MIGDYDPEDGYDVDDPPGVRLMVLERVVGELYAGDPDDPRREPRRTDALRLVANFENAVAEWRARLEAIRQALEDL